MSDWRFAIDSGGTFTDLIAVGPDQQQLTLKVPSVPDHPAMGPMNAIEAAMRQLGDVRVVDVAHGTTVGLNALLQRRFPRVALIVTRGFRNVLEIARHTVPGQWGSIYAWVKPPRVVPLEWVIEIDERVDANGVVLEALDADSLQRAPDIQQVIKSFRRVFPNHAHHDGLQFRRQVLTKLAQGRNRVGQVSEQHLHRYLAEFDFRYSNRVALGVSDVARSERAIRGIVGKRLMYRDSLAANA